MTRKIRNTTLAVVLGLLGGSALGNGISEKLDGSGFPKKAAQNQVTTQRAWGEMWLNEHDDGYVSQERMYAFAILKPAAQQVSQVRLSAAPRLGERLER